MNFESYKTAINARLKELGVRMHDIDDELAHAKTQDLNDQAIDLEDDEVLEGLGNAAQAEVAALTNALSRIKNKTYGICMSCEEPISEERLNAVLHAATCRNCANKATA